MFAVLSLIVVFVSNEPWNTSMTPLTINRMSERVLITGGAGFVGSHIVDELLDAGYEVTVYDALVDQVHDELPKYLSDDVKFIQADIRDDDALHNALRQTDILSHQAAAVGVSQSMYEIEEYVDINTLGTAKLLDIVVNDDEVTLDKMVIASSMSLYGEGQYYCEDCDSIKNPGLRPKNQLQNAEWQMKCPDCGMELEHIPTPESKPAQPTSVYAITKKDQEELCLSVGRAYDIPTVALRYFNIYGSRQSLENPYTGVCAIFSSRIKNGNPPLIFEDGNQVRDFIHVSDIARANKLAIEREDANMEAINIGTGTPTSINEVADALIELYGQESDLKPEIAGEFRAGDIRHAYADTTKAEHLLGFEADVEFRNGLQELVQWARAQDSMDLFDSAYEELEEKGLVD
jgi:dTDP-L-rhamnose 4-epimerase